MRRAVERYLEDPLAEEILRGTVKQSDVVEVTREGEIKDAKTKLVFKTNAPAAETDATPATAS